VDLFSEATSLPGLHDKKNIQEQQEKRKEVVSFSRILGFLEAMEKFGKIIEVFLNSSEMLCFVWGPLKFLLQVRILKIWGKWILFTKACREAQH
jgi:hypothetical protein